MQSFVFDSLSRPLADLEDKAIQWRIFCLPYFDVGVHTAVSQNTTDLFRWVVLEGSDHHSGGLQLIVFCKNLRSNVSSIHYHSKFVTLP